MVDRAGRTVGRRALLRAGAGGLVLVATGCGGEKETAREATAPPTQPAIASPVPGYVDPARWTGRTVTVASGGGEYQYAQAAAIFEPFAAATGATVQEKSFNLGELRQQVDQGDVTWDLVDVPTEEVLPLARADYLEPIDEQVVDTSPLFPELVMQHGIGAAFFSTVLAYPTGTDRVPEGWVDFWDVDRLPGTRALRRSPIGTLEFALLAAGVQRDKLYPLDVERAFAGLDALKPHVAQWYENAKQPVELVLSGAVVMASTFSVLAETVDAQAGLQLRWDGGMLSADSWVIPRGAPNADVAMDLINFATRAVPSANFASLVPYGPVNREALTLLRPERLPLLPNSDVHRAIQFVQGWNWWADNRETLTARFEEWVVEEPAPVLSGGTSER